MCDALGVAMNCPEEMVLRSKVTCPKIEALEAFRVNEVLISPSHSLGFSQDSNPMKIEPPPLPEPSEDGYETLGWYQPGEAFKLLKRFDDEGVYAQIDQSTGSDDASAVWGDMGRGFGIASQILISIHSSCREHALRIHRDLFGDDLASTEPEEFVEETGTDE